MKIKVFEPNRYGKIEFTRAELEKLLNEVYADGYKEGRYEAQSSWTWTSPYLNNTRTYDTITTAASNHADCSVTTGATENLTPTNSFSIKVNAEDHDTITRAVKELVENASSAFRPIKTTEDTFDRLAKELNF